MEQLFDIKSARKTLRLTQQALADELDVNISTIWRYEDGRLPVPKRVKLAISSLITSPTHAPVPQSLGASNG